MLESMVVLFKDIQSAWLCPNANLAVGGSRLSTNVLINERGDELKFGYL